MSRAWAKHPEYRERGNARRRNYDSGDFYSQRYTKIRQKFSDTPYLTVIISYDKRYADLDFCAMTVFSSGSGGANYVERSIKNRILGVKDFIDRDFGDISLSVDILAEPLGMSEVYFRRLFKSVVGASPKRYITKVRLDNGLS